MKKILLGLIFSMSIFVYTQDTFAQTVDPLPTQMPSSVQSESQNQQSLPNIDLNPYRNEHGQTAGGDACDPKKDIMLNISLPFIGRCIKKDAAAVGASDNPGNTTVGNVFPKLMGGLMRIVMTAIYIIGFLGILVGGFMIAASGADPSLKEKGKKIIIMIIGGLILLGASGIILNLINPNFFGVASG